MDDMSLAIEESLRFYNEVEIPRLSQLHSKKSSNSVWDVTDPRNQGAGCSRDPDVVYHEKEDDGIADQALRPESLFEHEDVPELYRGPEACGFHVSSGRDWIYPTNYPERKYQFDIVEKALYQNTLVSLPTGLGKTFIAAVVMYNFYRWYPQGKILFMAPTKPLVNQQVESCYKVMGIPEEDTVEMTGNLPPKSRKEIWQIKRVVFGTPQTITNDVTSGVCPVELIRCIVVDEAHKALKNYHYCQLVKSISSQNKHFRLLALSATPGNNLEAIKQVVQNLLISHIEVRTEESPDITPYTHKRKVETVILKQSPELKTYMERFLCIIDVFARQLRVHKLVGVLSKFMLVQAQKKFFQTPPVGISDNMKRQMNADFALCIALCHAQSMLETSGVRAFYNTMETFRCNPEKIALAKRLEKCDPFQELMAEVKAYVDRQDINKRDPNLSIVNPSQMASGPQYVGSHPKMEKVRDILLEHFSQFEDKDVSSKVIIFCEYRETVDEIEFILNQLRPLVKPRIFVGQSDTKVSRGLKQNQQKKILEQFRNGHTNTLVATCVGEEGLDIGEVDLIVCYDVVSHTRLVQRMGRTGRQREGRIVHLVSEGKEYTKYKTALRENIDIRQKIASDSDKLTPFLYQHNPDMFPQGMEKPTCRKILITPKPKEVAPKVAPKAAKNQDLRSFMTKDVKKGRKEFLTEDMYRDLWAMNNGQNPLDQDDLLPPQSFSCLMTIDELQEQQLKDNAFAQSNKIDLGDYIDWQRLPQGGSSAHHSTDTGILVDLMAYSDKLNAEGLNDSITGCGVDELVEVVCRTKIKPKKKKGYTKKVVAKTPVKKKKSAPAKKNVAKNSLHRFLQIPPKLSTTGSTNAQLKVEQKGIFAEPSNENDEIIIVDKEVEPKLPAEKLAMCERLLEELGKIDTHMSSINPSWERHIGDHKGTATCVCCIGLDSFGSQKDLEQKPERTHKEKREEALQWLKEHFKTNEWQLSSKIKDTDVNMINKNGHGSDLDPMPTCAKKQLNFDLGLDSLFLEDDDDVIIVDIEHQRDSKCTDKQNSSVCFEMSGTECSSSVLTLHPKSSELVDTIQCQADVDHLEQTKSASQSGPFKRVETISSPILPSQKHLRKLHSKYTSKGVETAMSPILKSRQASNYNSNGAKKMKLSLQKKPDTTRNTLKLEQGKQAEDCNIFCNEFESPNDEGLFAFETSPAILKGVTHFFASSSEEKQTPQRLHIPNRKAKKKLDMHSVNASTSDLISMSNSTKNVVEGRSEVPLVCEKTDMQFNSPVIGKSTKKKMKKVPTHNDAVSPILGFRSQGNERTAALLGPVSSTPKQHKVALFAQCSPVEMSSSRGSPGLLIPNKTDSVGHITCARPTFTKVQALTPIIEEGSSFVTDDFMETSLIQNKNCTAETTGIVPSIHFNVYDDIDNIFDVSDEEETQIDLCPTEAMKSNSKMKPCRSKSVHQEAAYEESMYTLDQMLAKVDGPKNEACKAQTSNHLLMRKTHKTERRRLSLKGSLSRRESDVRKTNVDMRANYDSDKDLFASEDEYILQGSDALLNASCIHVELTKKLDEQTSRIKLLNRAADVDIVTKSHNEQILDSIDIDTHGELNVVETFNNAHANKNVAETKSKNFYKDARKVGQCSLRRTNDQSIYSLPFNDVSTLKIGEPLNTSLKRKASLSSLNKEVEENSKPLSPKKNVLKNSNNRFLSTEESYIVPQGNRSDGLSKVNHAKRALLFDTEDTQDLWKQADSRLEESRLTCVSQSSPHKETSKQSPVLTRKTSASVSKRSLDKSKARAGNISLSFNTTSLEHSPVLGGRAGQKTKLFSDHSVSSDSTIGLKKKPRALANISTTSEESPLTKKFVKDSNRTSANSCFRPTLAQTNRTEVDSECSSSSDDDFEKPPGNENPTKSVVKSNVGKENQGKISNTSTRPIKKSKAKNVHIGRPKGCVFVDNEASESSLDQRDSTDGENTSGLDDYDESFVHDELSQPSMTQNIQAQYIRYQIDAPDVRYNRPKPNVNRANVFSQEVTAEDDTYLDDSFVNDASSDAEGQSEMSVLERAEYRLKKAQRKKRKKRKRTSLGAQPASSDESQTESQTPRRGGKTGIKSKKRKRIMTLDSSDSAGNNPSDISGVDNTTLDADKMTKESSTHVFAVPHRKSTKHASHHATSNNSAVPDTYKYGDLLEDINWDDDLFSSDTAFIPKPEDKQCKHMYTSSSKATTLSDPGSGPSN